MANQKNQNVTEKAQEPVQNEVPVVQAEPVAQTAEVATEQKNGFGKWLKKHWKAVVGGVTGALAVGGSAVVAYKKGKAAGINSVPLPDQEDYSLNPNE